MASTEYMTLVNRVLRRLNEVEIVQADFASTRGVHSLAKDAVNTAINEINLMEFEWPFNSAAGSQVLTAGTEEYSFPATLKVIKWDSFHLTADDALSASGHPIKFISRDQWHKYLKNDDDIAGAAGLNEPVYVFEKLGFGFGLSPSPDAAYTVTFDYFIEPVELSAYNDTSTIYSSYDEAIIQGALAIMYMHRDNDSQAASADKKFKAITGRMRTILINKDDRVRSTMIIQRKASGGIISNDYFRY